MTNEPPALVHARPLPTSTARGATSFLERIDRTTVIPLALVLAVLVGVGDYLTGVELAFTLLYALPIGIATWFRGKAFGVLVAVVSVALAVTSEVVATRGSVAPRHGFTLFWNHGGSLGLYLGGVELIGRLEAFVRREAREKRIAVEQLRHAERLTVIGKLAAGVAHELGTPLNVIMGSAELLRASPYRAESHDRLTTRILEQTTKMTAIIRHLLDFGRKGGAGKVSVELASLARDGAALFRPLAEKRGVTIATLGEDKLFVMANRVELEQILSNLVMNALEATERKGVITISTRARFDLGQERELAELSVSDEGAGIRPEDLPYVFDPFFTTKEVGVGTGLGLSVSFGIVQDHGGRIDVTSHVGEGSTFTVLLPRS